jgi:carboxyl-terminal processing protease
MRLFAVLLAASLLGSATVHAAADDPVANDPGAVLEQELKRFLDVFVTVDREAADPADPDQVFYQGAIPAALRTLDPHSIFFDPDQFQQLQQMQQSEAKGFGTIVNILPGRVIVLQTMDGSPSQKAGLSAGDEIVGINNYVLSRLDPDQLVGLLSEARQHTVVLTIRRPGSVRLLEMTLSPELIDTPSVDRAFQIASGIGYLRIKSFEGQTGRLLKEKIEALGGAGLKGLIIDLRDNPGGAVQSAVTAASLFLKPDQLIFKVQGRKKPDSDSSAKNKNEEEVRVPALNRPYEFPVTLLVDGKTASAAEILSGALQDHDRARILGQPTYGKGLVQNVSQLMGNTGLALTVAFYYTPSGRSIQKPLASGNLNVSAAMPAGSFRTDAGRTVLGGGGIQPDEAVFPLPVTQLVGVLEASGVLTTFATEYLQAHADLPETFDVTPALLDELKVFLSANQIQPSIGEWLRDRDLIQSRLKQEIINLKFGVEKGDRVELERDPVVKRALQSFPAR